MRTALVLLHRLLRHELRLLHSLVLWLTRRTHGTQGGQAFGYARGQSLTLFGFAFVCVVETLTMSVLLRDYPTAHWIVLVLDVYTVLFVLGLHAASVVRPHLLGPDTLRIRRAVHVDLRIPVRHITAVRRESRITPDGGRPEGELDLPIGSQTTLTLELAQPVAHFTFLGRRRDVRLVRFHADDADTLVRAVRQVVTQARTAPSPLPGQPA
ncbi:hypothetical protein ACIRPX_06570 [Streptomyces sp. NPDC101225]|uniref:hypothetical protein n=1 Tax=Streptomyces sp. NPDC101225 TaxID=3366135 RepID=UPI00382E82E1